MVLGRFHCSKCGVDTDEYTSTGSKDFVCPNCGQSSPYTIANAIDNATCVCPICSKSFETNNFVQDVTTPTGAVDGTDKDNSGTIDMVM